MAKVYIQSDPQGILIDYDHFNAYWGFRQLGCETIFYNTHEDLLESEKEDIVVGYSGPVKVRLNDLGLSIPNIDYPESITKYLGRRIEKSSLRNIISSPEKWNAFIKPISNKSFSGRVIRSAQDLIGCDNGDPDQEIYVSEVVNFVSEYRVFVRYGEILDMKHYHGDWRILPDVDVIQACIADYGDAPKAYAIDFGVTDNGRTLLIEINVSGSIGSYGLDPINYAKFMATRWSELTGTEDQLQ